MPPPATTPTPTPTLPILDRRQEIEDALRRHQVIVVCGETGSGKTTQLPQICLDMGRPRVIAHTQPRRLAARAVAARIAEERGTRVGGLVGVKIRFQDQTSRQTRIKVMTDGMLLAELTSDRHLESYGTIIIDEAHERSLNIDFLLGYLRQLLPTRPDLRLIITSATIDPQRFSNHFGGPSVAPVIEVSGRMYPVETRYRPTDADEDEFERLEVEAVADAVDELASPRLPEGDVLVFLPGEREIRLAGDAIRRRAVDADILPLFSRLTNQEQDRIFHPGPRRRVILATNVAETSLTVPGIHYVVDTGLARLSRYDPARKIQRLPIEPISRASANQRSGRCGRVAAGICIRLYSDESYRARPAFTDPEVRRTNLASVILQMKALDLGPIEEFPFLDPPDTGAIKDGYETLFELGALDAPTGQAAVTPIGRSMSRLPLDPRIARMLLAAQGEGALSEILVLAAVLSIQDPRQRPMDRQEDADRTQLVFRHESSDFLTLLKLWDQFSHAAENSTHGGLLSWCRQHFLSAARMREWGEMVRQLADIAEELELKPSQKPATEDAIHRALLTGLISNVACREAEGGSFDYRGVRGNTVQIFPGSVLFKKGPRWIMAAEIVQTTRLYARTLARIDPDWIEELAGHMFQHQYSDRHLDQESGQPSAWERVTMSGIVVVPRRRAPIAAIDPTAARKLFIREGLSLGKWATDAPFMQHNRLTLERAQSAESRLRRRNLILPEDDLADWFDKRVPPQIREPIAFNAWLADAERTDPNLLRLTLRDLLQPSALPAFDPALYPDAIDLGEGPARRSCPLDYALAPGKDEDGVTLTATLLALAQLTPDRAAWLIPGLLPELVQSLIKTLPKPSRAALEAKGNLADIALACAAVLRFGDGSLPHSLSEAIQILYDTRIDPAAWSLKALPAHLRLRIQVTDDAGKPLGADRDVAALLQRFESRIRKAQSAGARSAFERHGLTTWDFGDLPESVLTDRDGSPVTTYPALVDHTDSVSLTLLSSPDQAAAHTARALRRLFALACRDEVNFYLDALPQWADMTRQYAQFGPAEDLRRDLTCIIADRTFLEGQPPIRTKAQYNDRLAASWGRLSTIAREVGDTVARILEPRFKVAQRFSGGTPRLWADSVADIREHAAYLMPRGFLLLVPWERLRHYPRYVESMRERLFALREDGSKVESVSLQKFLPHWKLLTAYVASRLSAQRADRQAEDTLSKPTTKPAAKTKAPLPQARRAAPTVNLDAGEWAMQPGNLPAAVERYRWALEELRVNLFAPQLAGKATVSEAEVSRLWAAVKS